MSEGDWKFFSAQHPRDPVARQWLTVQYPADYLVDLESEPGIMMKQACLTRQKNNGIVETLALAWDTRMQKMYNREQMIEARCDDDMVAAATDQLEDSEEFEYFYDWLMRLSNDVTQSNERMPPYFMRFVKLISKGGQLVGKDSFVHFDTGIWTHSVVQDGKGFSTRQKSGSCEMTNTEGGLPHHAAKIQTRNKLDSHDKSRFFVVTELAEKGGYRDTVELQEGIKANVSKQPTNAVFLSKSQEFYNRVVEEKVVQQIDLHHLLFKQN